MKDLPRLLLKAPKIFYAFAVFYAFYNVVEPIMQLNSVGVYGGLPSGNDDLMRFAYARLVANAIYQSLFLFGFGVLADLLIAIWRNTRPRDAVEGAE
jgi:hypothetical protein